MEGDFWIAEDVFVPRKRGGQDPANLEMALYFRQQLPYIPQDIPKLSEEEAARAIPDRFKDPKMQREVQVLDYYLEHDRDGGDDEEDVSWVDGKGTRDSGGAVVGGESSDSPLEGLADGES